MTLRVCGNCRRKNSCANLRGLSLSHGCDNGRFLPRAAKERPVRPVFRGLRRSLAEDGWDRWTIRNCT